MWASFVARCRTSIFLRRSISNWVAQILLSFAGEGSIQYLVATWRNIDYIDYYRDTPQEDTILDWRQTFFSRSLWDNLHVHVSSPCSKTCRDYQKGFNLNKSYVNCNHCSRLDVQWLFVVEHCLRRALIWNRIHLAWRGRHTEYHVCYGLDVSFETFVCFRIWSFVVVRHDETMTRRHHPQWSCQPVGCLKASLPEIRQIPRLLLPL